MNKVLLLLYIVFCVIIQSCDVTSVDDYISETENEDDFGFIKLTFNISSTSSLDIRQKISQFNQVDIVFNERKYTGLLLSYNTDNFSLELTKLLTIKANYYSISNVVVYNADNPSQKVNIMNDINECIVGTDAIHNIYFTIT